MRTAVSIAHHLIGAKSFDERADYTRVQSTGSCLNDRNALASDR
jgi:hypothetical protein